MFSVIAHDGQSYGPVDVPTLVRWCQQGRIVADTYLMEANTGRTMTASQLPELQAILGSASPGLSSGSPYMPQTGQTIQPGAVSPNQIGVGIYQPGTHQPNLQQPQIHPTNPYALGQYPPPSAYGAVGLRKSKTVALLLCFFLGFLGGHRFYLGYTSSAIAVVVLSALSLAFCIPAIIVMIWNVLDFAAIAAGQMRDAQGLELV